MGSSVILPAPGQPREGPDPGFTSGSIPNIVSFNFHNIAPPSIVYIGRDDALITKVVSSFAGGDIAVSGRLLLPIGPFVGQPDHSPADPFAVPTVRLGVIVPFRFDYATVADRNAHENLQPLQEGFLLSVAVGAPLITTRRGQTWVSVGVQRNNLITTRYQELIADYAHSNMDLAWPGGRVINALDGGGFLHSLQQANPAAGADWTLTVPANARFRIQSINAQLLTSATAGNRIPRIQIRDAAADLVWQAPPSQVIPASTTAQVSAGQGQVTSTTDPASVNIALPGNTLLSGGFTVGTSTTGILAGDQWSAIWFDIEEWLEPIT